jgi:hypothetical protein
VSVQMSGPTARYRSVVSPTFDQLLAPMNRRERLACRVAGLLRVPEYPTVASRLNLDRADGDGSHRDAPLSRPWASLLEVRLHTALLRVSRQRRAIWDRRYHRLVAGWVLACGLLWWLFAATAGPGLASSVPTVAGVAFVAVVAAGAVLVVALPVANEVDLGRVARVNQQAPNLAGLAACGGFASIPAHWAVPRTLPEVYRPYPTAGSLDELLDELGLPGWLAAQGLTEAEQEVFEVLAPEFHGSLSELVSACRLLS